MITKNRQKLKKNVQKIVINQIVGYNPSTNTTFPVLVEMYSSVSDDFESANKEAFKIIRDTVSSVGTKPLWVMDRNYDDIKYFGLMEELGCSFMIRMKQRLIARYERTHRPIIPIIFIEPVWLEVG